MQYLPIVSVQSCHAKLSALSFGRKAHAFESHQVSAPLKLDCLKLEFSTGFLWLGEGWNRKKASKFTEAQKAFILKQGAQVTPVTEICCKAGISQATYFNWNKKYGGLLPNEMRRLKALEDENARLKKTVADLTLEREMLQNVIRRKL
jgi:hypothetical protein